MDSIFRISQCDKKVKYATKWLHYEYFSENYCISSKNSLHFKHQIKGFTIKKGMSVMLAKRLGLALLITVVMGLFITQYVSAAPNVRVYFNGVEIQYDVPAQIIADHTMVPIQKTVTAITGSPVVWNAETESISFYAFGRYVTHKLGTTVVYVDGAPMNFPTPSLIIDGRTLVPIKMIADAADTQVVWDPINYYVIITRAVTTPVAPIAPVPPVVEPITPTVPVVPAVPAVVISRVDADSTSVYAGDPITFTIRTNAAANAVWINYDNKDTYATSYTADATTAYKIWTISFYPARSQTVTIYANYDRSFTNAVKQTKRITVGAHELKIYSVDADNTSVNFGEYVYITVKTNADVTSVRGVDGGNTIPFSYNTTNAAGQKIWTASYAPQATTQVWIYASATGLNDATDSIRLYVQNNVRPDIYKVTVNPGYVIGNAVTYNDFTVTTNTAVANVYVVMGGQRFYADPYPANYGGNLVWTISRVPLQTLIDAGGSFSVTVTAQSNDGQTVDRATSITIQPGAVTPIPL